MPSCLSFLLRGALPALLALSLHAEEAAVSRPAAEGSRVLVTGHSFHVPVMAVFDQLSQRAGLKNHKIVARSMIGGSRVGQHWELPEEKNIAKTTLRAGGVDVLTMAPNWVVPDDAVEKFVRLGLEKNPGLRAYVQISWYPWDGLYPPLRVAANEERDSRPVSDLHAAYDPFRDIIRKQAQEINARIGRQVVYVVPVGEAVLRLREAVAAGKVPGVSRPSQLFTDAIGHAREAVLLLAAYCQYACIQQRSPIGLAAPAGAEKVSPELVALLQKLAWEAVLDEPLAGVKDVAIPR